MGKGDNEEVDNDDSKKGKQGRREETLERSRRLTTSCPRPFLGINNSKVGKILDHDVWLFHLC